MRRPHGHALQALPRLHRPSHVEHKKCATFAKLCPIIQAPLKCQPGLVLVLVHVLVHVSRPRSRSRSRPRSCCRPRPLVFSRLCPRYPLILFLSFCPTFILHFTPSGTLSP